MMILKLKLATLVLTLKVAGGALPTTPYATRFWDCCQPAFAYPNPSLYTPVDTCQKDGKTLIPLDARKGHSGCDGGDQFACSCIQPWVDSKDTTLGYGFAAYNIHPPDGTIEGACYYAEFQKQDSSGKAMKVYKMILQNINTSLSILKGSFDINLAGGGVGDYNKGCAAQWGSDWGKQYGGVTKAEECCSLPLGLQSSCMFRFLYLGDNPALASTPVRVRCPVGIVNRSGAQRKDDANVKPYSGIHDETGTPAEDHYQRDRSVCSNIDPLGVVSSVCGGSYSGGTGGASGGSGSGQGAGSTVGAGSGGSSEAGGAGGVSGGGTGATGTGGGGGSGSTSEGSPSGKDKGGNGSGGGGYGGTEATDADDGTGAHGGGSGQLSDTSLGKTGSALGTGAGAGGGGGLTSGGTGTMKRDEEIGKRGKHRHHRHGKHHHPASSE